MQHLPDSLNPPDACITRTLQPKGTARTWVCRTAWPPFEAETPKFGAECTIAPHSYPNTGTDIQPNLEAQHEALALETRLSPRPGTRTELALAKYTSSKPGSSLLSHERSSGSAKADCRNFRISSSLGDAFKSSARDAPPRTTSLASDLGMQCFCWGQESTCSRFMAYDSRFCQKAHTCPHDMQLEP